MLFFSSQQHLTEPEGKNPDRPQTTSFASVGASGAAVTRKWRKAKEEDEKEEEEEEESREEQLEEQLEEKLEEEEVSKSSLDAARSHPPETASTAERAPAASREASADRQERGPQS